MPFGKDINDPMSFIDQIIIPDEIEDQNKKENDKNDENKEIIEVEKDED